MALSPGSPVGETTLAVGDTVASCGGSVSTRSLSVCAAAAVGGGDMVGDVTTAGALEGATWARARGLASH